MHSREDQRRYTPDTKRPLLSLARRFDSINIFLLEGICKLLFATGAGYGGRSNRGGVVRCTLKYSGDEDFGKLSDSRISNEGCEDSGKGLCQY